MNDGEMLDKRDKQAMDGWIAPWPCVEVAQDKHDESGGARRSPGGVCDPWGDGSWGEILGIFLAVRGWTWMEVWAGAPVGGGCQTPTSPVFTASAIISCRQQSPPSIGCYVF